MKGYFEDSCNNNHNIKILAMLSIKDEKRNLNLVTIMKATNFHKTVRRCKRLKNSNRICSTHK